MELYRVQTRKPNYQQQQRQPLQQQVKLTRDGKTIRRCKFCDLEVLFIRDSNNRLLVKDARHFFTPIYEGEEYVMHRCGK